MTTRRLMLTLAAGVLILGGVPRLARAQGAPPPAGADLRLAVVDMDRVMVESDMGKAEQAGLDKLKADRTNIITSKQKELEAMEEQIRNASLSWSDEKREETSRAYEARRIELRRLNEDATRDVQAEFNRSLQKMQKAALEVTMGIGKERGFTLIFEKNTAPVLYATDAIEITSEVISRLNAKARQAGPKPPATPPPASPKPSGGGNGGI